ncbi:hypothetical protein [Aliikangiella coralliicola]|uniref:SPOR domain-containing protein n=1 Tax=Aliikangiella coralliicola TaxID=2592383 RepID=A0A545U7N4_9GAMM|nr:hypothetical protein [Aliikangiella coralliicola]TQV85477.1 hypothetical protein FLL46_20140 [Aliikangiella coralliicola]
MKISRCLAKKSNCTVKNCIKTSLVSLFLLSAQFSFSNPAIESANQSTEKVKQVGNSVDSYKPQTLISSQKAKRIVRRFLFSRGYSKQIAPGGAQIREIVSDGPYWKVLVGLRKNSATSVEKHLLYVSKQTGLLSEVRPVSQERLVDSTKKLRLKNYKK